MKPFYRNFFFIILLFIFHSSSAQEIKSPDSFLGYALGTHYTPHYRIIEYLRYLTGVSTKIKILEYGTTIEGRPLLVCIVSTEENLTRLEEIRKNNMGLAGLEPNTSATITLKTPVIVWLSYNVHGNEPSSSEAAMETLYEILSHSEKVYKNILSRTVLILDPCINPDGRDRYVNFINQVSGEIPDPSPFVREHNEPWPGGRFNHYLFDLNRDWAWQTQKETQQRLQLYNAWLPQVHVDFHEMGINSPYYFSPAAEPLHAVITPWQRKFQEIIGQKNAQAFEKNGWLYFNREDYDLLYPSYGDTYPTYNGSIGMTYEQAGGPHGGLKILIATGDTLSLIQRIEHHFTTGMTTWLTASENAETLLREFKNYFSISQQSPVGDYKSYLIQFEPGELWKKTAFEKYLQRNGIRFGKAKPLKDLLAYNYFHGKSELVNAREGDLLISAYQPKSRLLEAIMEPKTYLSDSITYDITAWGLPYAWGIRAYGLGKPIPFLLERVQDSSKLETTIGLGGEKPYAYLLPWTGLPSLKGLSYLWNEGVKIRFFNEPMTLNNIKYPEGTLLITLESNRYLKRELSQIIRGMESKLNLRAERIQSAFYTSSEGFASKKVHFLNRPEIGLAFGSSVEATGFGEIWHYLDHELGFPSHNISLDGLNSRVLKNLSVLIIPNLQNVDNLNSEALGILENWVRGGGKLILIEKAVNRFLGEKGFNIKARHADTLLTTPLKTIDPISDHYSDRERKSLRNEVVGSIFKVQVDNSNPLGYGFPTTYFSLKNQSFVLDYLPKDKGWNVGTFKSDSYVSGFTGDLFKKQIQNSLAFGWQDYGSGSVVYFTDDPIFRGFWINGKLLLGNALFMVGN